MIIFGGVFTAMALVILLTGVLSRRSAKKYEGNAIHTKGLVSAYYQQDTRSKWDTPVIIASIDGKDVKDDCMSRRMNAKVCPIGSEVEISYVQKKLFGNTIYNMRMEEDDYKPISSSIFGNIMILIGLVMLVAGIYLMVTGL